MDGILIIDKPEGVTSHDVVQAIRKRFGMRKVGHLGTLDPMATGVLPVSLGRATRLAQFLPASPKEYSGEIRFGFSTNTYDREGSPTSGEKPLDRKLHRSTCEPIISSTPRTPCLRVTPDRSEMSLTRGRFRQSAATP